jgi:hypothetical protein
MGELECRLRCFDDAKAKFQNLAGRAEFWTDRDHDIVELQARLLKDMNSRRERILSGKANSIQFLVSDQIRHL